MVKGWTNILKKQSPKTNPHIYGHLLYEKDATENLCAEKTAFSINGPRVLETSMKKQ